MRVHEYRDTRSECCSPRAYTPPPSPPPTISSSLVIPNQKYLVSGFISPLYGIESARFDSVYTLDSINRRPASKSYGAFNTLVMGSEFSRVGAIVTDEGGNETKKSARSINQRGWTRGFDRRGVLWFRLPSLLPSWIFNNKKYLYKYLYKNNVKLSKTNKESSVIFLEQIKSCVYSRVIHNLKIHTTWTMLTRTLIFYFNTKYCTNIIAP